MKHKATNTILIVDDEAFNVQLLDQFLSVKYETLSAYNGKEALELIRTEDIDLVLLDVMMPGMDGFEVCRAIKSSISTRFIPVIIITALSDREDRLNGLEAGADDFLEKPVDRLEVLTRVSNLLEKKQLYDELVFERDRTQNYLDIAGSMIVAFDIHGTIKLVNKKCCHVLGYDESELIGRNWIDMIVPVEEQEIASCVFNKLFNGDIDDYKEFESTILTKSGEKRIIRWNNSFFSDLSLNDSQIISSGSDVTEERLAVKKLKLSEESYRLLAEEMSMMNNELKSLDRMKDEFISNLSHELKTPLISIKGYSELVYDEVMGPLNSKQKAAMKTVLEKYDNLSYLIDSLIYMSIVKSGKVAYRLDPIRIMDSLSKVVDYFEFRSQNKNLLLLIDIEDNLPLIRGDVEYMPYIFRALIDNAIKFSPNGSTVLIKAFNDDGNIHVLVEDSGIGIPRTELDKIFRRFYQIDGSISRKYGGSGLGLYVSKTIAEIHGGSIWIESEEGSGTIVHVLLPQCSSISLQEMDKSLLSEE